MQNTVRYGLLAALLLIYSAAAAQTVDDALRYSNTAVIGTARFAATGGALTPLGSDFSTLSTNPAGIGWVRNSSLVVTPSFKLASIDSRLNNAVDARTIGNTDTKFSVGSLGVMIAGRTRSLNWTTFNFGIGLNRLADFNEEFRYRGQSQGSIVEGFVDLANRGEFSDFGNNLGIQAEAVLLDDLGYFSDFDINRGDNSIIEREQTVTRTGGISELVFGFGGSFRDRVMWGLTLGVPFLDYSETKVYTEFDANGVIENFDDLTFEESFTTTGAGVNIKAGLLLRPVQPLRISLAVHTPTWLRLDDTFSTAFTYNFTFDGVPQGSEARSPEGDFGYRLSTPWRVLGGLGWIFGKSGFLSADLEYVNYGAAQFGFDNFIDEERAANAEIDDLLGSALNVRVGGEYVLSDFRLRGGLQLRPSPVESLDERELIYSGGLGYQRNKFAIDLAYQYGNREGVFIPYRVFTTPEQLVENSFSRHRLLLSLGFQF